MTIQTDYGMVEYEESDLLIFPDGLFGFPKLTQYLLLYLNEDDDSMLLLQSVEECKVGFVLINPFLLCPDYSPELTPEELAWRFRTAENFHTIQSASCGAIIWRIR